LQRRGTGKLRTFVKQESGGFVDPMERLAPHCPGCAEVLISGECGFAACGRLSFKYGVYQ